jgi:hypothetical protein
VRTIMLHTCMLLVSVSVGGLQARAQTDVQTSNAGQGGAIMAESVAAISDSVTENSPAEAKPKFTPSYGSFANSIFFSSRQIEQMKKVLFLAERFGDEPPSEEAVAQEDIDLLEGFELTVPKQEEETITTPTVFPAFYVSSILYRGPNDWVFWMNGERVTPDSVLPELRVTAIQSRSVSLLWSPGDPESFLLYQDMLRKEEPPIGLKKRLSKGRNVQEPESGKWAFTLRPNQTFDSRFFAVLEGNKPRIEGAASDIAVRGVEEITAEELLRREGFDAQLPPEPRATALPVSLSPAPSAVKRVQPSGIRSDANLPSDRNAATPAMSPAPPQPSVQNIQDATSPAMPESASSASPMTQGAARTRVEDNPTIRANVPANTSQEGLPLLPN